jgi:hypothetical protein
MENKTTNLLLGTIVMCLSVLLWNSCSSMKFYRAQELHGQNIVCGHACPSYKIDRDNSEHDKCQAVCSELYYRKLKELYPE